MANDPELYFKKRMNELEKIGAAHAKPGEFTKNETEKQKEHLEEAYKVVAHQDFINRKNIKYILQPKDPKERKKRFLEARKLKLIDESVTFKLLNDHRYLFYATPILQTTHK